MFTAGRLSDGPRFRAMTYDMLDAAIVDFAYTEVIKVAVGRERPNGEDNQSFPSGHTSNGFALAAVAERHYGWKLGVPACLLAGVVGASRIQQDKHYLSDVVAGATLGYIVGRTIVRVKQPPARGGASRLVVPCVAGPGTADARGAAGIHVLS
jgi:membrane-associated phospholipid phosphatase